MELNKLISDAMESIEYKTAEVKRIMSEPNLKTLDLTCVSSISIYDGGIAMYLDKDSDRELQRKFINQVSRVYGVKLNKEKSYGGGCLSCSAVLSDERSLDIYGYVPPTCEIKEVEQDASEWELENARKQIEKAQALLSAGKKIVKQVVCQ